jgi:hypothetical protein
VVKYKHTRRPVFSVTYDPRLPDLPGVQRKHWRSMTIQDEHLENVFPEPPLIAYKRQKNLSDFLIRAKLPPIPRPYEKQKSNAMKKCNKCIICPYIKEGKSVKGRTFDWKINRNINCTSQKNIIYMIECNKENCNQRYIGETKFDLKTRLSQHLGYINTRILNQPTGNHFNLPGHSKHNLKATVLEKVKVNNLQYRKEREHFHIRKFQTFYSGMNLKP